MEVQVIQIEFDFYVAHISFHTNGSITILVVVFIGIFLASSSVGQSACLLNRMSQVRVLPSQLPLYTEIHIKKEGFYNRRNYEVRKCRATSIGTFIW